MTKVRPPLSIENTLFKVFGALEIEHASEVTGRTPHYLRNLADPAKREKLTVVDQIKLDLAWRQKGRPGAPLYEQIGRIMKAADAEIFSDSDAIGDIARRVIKEGSEAHLALFAASRPAATEAELLSALREVEESTSVSQQALAVIKSVIAHKVAQPP